MKTTVLTCDRISKGKPTTKDIVVSLSDSQGQPLPILSIATDYQPRKGEYKSCETYTVEEIVCHMDGRGFRLVKESTGDVYDLRIANTQDKSCDCYGFTAHGRCKHMDAMLEILATNSLPSPHDWPVECLPVFDPENDPFA